MKLWKFTFLSSKLMFGCGVMDVYLDLCTMDVSTALVFDLKSMNELDGKEAQS